MKRLLICTLMLIFSNFTFAAAVPAYTGGINNAVGSIVQQKTVRWGFAANDPRFGATVSAIGTAATSVAVGVATGAVATVGWPALLIGAGVSGVVSGAVQLGVDGLINWLWPDLSHPSQVQLSGTGMNGTVPMFSNGTVSGQLCWGVTAECFGSPQEVLSYLFSVTQAQYPTATYGVPTLVQNSSTQYTATYAYSIPSLNLNNQTGTKIITSHTANITCPFGSGYSGSGTLACTSANLAKSPYASSFTPYWESIMQAIKDIPQSYATQALSDAQLAAIANALWKNASIAQNSQTIPWNSSDPITPSDITAWRAQNPGLVPTVNDFISPVAPAGASNVVIPNPGTSATTPTPSTTPGTTTTPAEIDWGSFDEPSLDPTPTTESILDPIFNMWPQWNSYAFPSHTSSCPTPTFIALGHTFTFDHMCTWVEMIRPAVQAAFALIWALMVIFIVMGA